jgi:DAK2 domain fusion protein YloV
MVLTMQSAWNEIAATPENSVSAVAHALAHGALMGARGTSGVILSQLWRGFARSLDKMSTVDARGVAEALAEARETAYRGVVRPVEGTILTVSTDVAEAARAALDEGATSGLEVLERVARAAEESVERTPELLPVLREAGVVDSGGKGLYFILEGMLRAAYRLPLDESLVDLKSFRALAAADLSESIEPGQDWEVVVDFEPALPFDLASFHRCLAEMGTSIQIAEGDGRYRMHIHVPDRTEQVPLEYIRGLGTVLEYRVENLMLQLGGSAADQPVTLAQVEPDQVAVVAVSPGKGLSRLFGSLGVASIVEGGQTMNPSAQDILQALESLSASRIIVLPNNKNIVLTAQQAAQLTGKDIRVVSTTSVPQGLAAMLPYEAQADLETLTKEMERARLDVRTGELTTATRSVEVDGVAVREGQIIGLLDGKLVVGGDTLSRHCPLPLRPQQAELITIYPQRPSGRHGHQLWCARRIRLSSRDPHGGQPHIPVAIDQ